MLESLFKSDLRVRALAAVLLEPDRRFYVRELARGLHVSEGSLHRELTSLSDAGILKRQEDGNRVYYSADQTCPIFPELRGLLLKTVALADVLRQALEPLGTKVEAAFVYGSLAKGREGPESDVDLMVVGDAEFGDVVRTLGQAQEQLGRDVNPTVYPVAELQQKLQAGHHFLTTVLAEDKLFVIGDADELERLAGQRLAEGTQDEPTGDR